MNISVEWLLEKDACEEAIDSFKNQAETDSLKILRLLIEEKNLKWASWLIVRVMDYRQYLSYTIFLAKSVIDKFEKIYPNDKRPRCAIEGAKKHLKNKEAMESAKFAENAAGDAKSEAWAVENAAALMAWTATSETMQLKILTYGVELLEKRT